VPVPPPIAQLLRQHLGDRPNMQTAANPTSPWLFPGLRAGQPLTADRMNHQLRNLGIPLRQARNSALRQLVQDMPPAVAARTLGYSQKIVEHPRRASRSLLQQLRHRTPPHPERTVTQRGPPADACYTDHDAPTAGPPSPFWMAEVRPPTRGTCYLMGRVKPCTECSWHPGGGRCNRR